MEKPENTTPETAPIKLLPTWRQALADIETMGLEPGQVISKDWLEEAFGIQPPQTVEQVERNRLQFMRCMTAFRNALLEKHQYMLRALPGQGYEVISPDRQTEVAMRDRGQEIKRALQSLVLELTHIRAEELTDEQRRENTDALAKVGALAGMASKQLEFKKDSN